MPTMRNLHQPIHSPRIQSGSFQATTLKLSTINSMSHLHLKRPGAFKLPCLDRKIENRQENAFLMCRGGGEHEGKYMTVNLSLIVGHIRRLEGAFSQGEMLVLEYLAGMVVGILRGRS
jgi:hypothetical protein